MQLIFALTDVTLKSDFLALQTHWDPREFNVITIPNNLQKRGIMKRVSQALDNSKHRNDVAGKRFKRISRAWYPAEPNFRYELDFSNNLPKRLKLTI